MLKYTIGFVAGCLVATALLAFAVWTGWILEDESYSTGVETRSTPAFQLECVTYANLREVQAGLLERDFRHSAFLGLANSKGGERADGSQYGYFRIDPTYISEYVVCFYDWPPS